MNNDLDSWLSSLGFEEEERPSPLNTVAPEDVSVPTPPNLSVQSVDASLSESSETQEPVALSNEDFDDILNDYGFSRPENAQAEEIIEEDNTEEQLEFNPEDVRDETFEITTDTIADSNDRAYADLGDGQRVYLHNEVVDAVNSSAEETATQDLEFTISVAPVAQGVSEAPSSSSSIQEPLIPLNSPTLLLDETTTRFSGAEWFNEIQKQHIIVAGCGGIGSWLILQLARMHPATMILYDDDRVEAVNMAGQLYAFKDIGKYKVTAMSDMISSYTNANNVFAVSQRFTPTTEAGDIMMCGFDNMEARRTFFGCWCNHLTSKTPEERKKCLFLDGRLSMDTLQVFAITGDDNESIMRYQDSYLFSDSDADATVCSMKQTTYLACMIGSIMTNLFTNWVANSLDPIIPYDLPFFTEYDAQNMIFKTIK